MATQANRIDALEAGQSAILEALQALLGQDEQPTPAKGKRQASKRQNIGRESTFNPAVAKQNGWNGKVGGTFHYQGKRGQSTWKVTGTADHKGRVPCTRTA